MHFSISLLIRRPPEEVFGALADAEGITRWNPAIGPARLLTPGPIDKGSRVQLQRTRPRPATEQLEVIEYRPYWSLVLRGDLGRLRGDLIYDLETVPEGTRLMNEADLDARGPLRFFAPLATRRVRGAVADNLGALRRLLEAADRGGTDRPKA